LDVEGVEDGLIDGGDVGVQDGHVHLLQCRHRLDQLPRPPPRQDLDHGVHAHHPHLYVRDARLVLRHLLPDPAAHLAAAARVEVQCDLGHAGACTVTGAGRRGERDARGEERRRRRRRLLHGRRQNCSVGDRPCRWRWRVAAVQAPPLLRLQALDQLLQLSYELYCTTYDGCLVSL
ncbi:Os05g0586350, partial [Oryza sativa Japonica Group]